MLVLLGFHAAPRVAVAADLEPKTDEEKAFYAFGRPTSARSSARSRRASVRDAEGGADGRDPEASRQDRRQAVHPEVPDRQTRRRPRRKPVRSSPTRRPRRRGATKTASGDHARGGESPKATDKVKVHYKGTLTNGTIRRQLDRVRPAGNVRAEPGHQMLDRRRAADEGRGRVVRLSRRHRVRRPTSRRRFPAGAAPRLRGRDREVTLSRWRAARPASPRAGATHRHFADGTRTVNVEPTPGVLSTATVPPSSSTSRFTMCSPRPTPPKRRVERRRPGGTSRR